MQALKTAVGYQDIKNYRYFYESADTGYLKEKDRTPFTTAEILFRSKFSSTPRTVLITLYRVFHEVLSTMLVLHQAVVKQPTDQEPVSQRILGDSKYASYFKDCIGALDGTHVNVYVSGESSVPYRNRKGTLTQNVLVVCDFELHFRYVLAGWEGSAHDMRVLKDAVSNGSLKAPPGKFYLGDAGYTHGEWILTPFRGVKYHLRETWAADKRYLRSILCLNAPTNYYRPENEKEIFNLRHSTLRNVVERVIGILKRRWKILRLAPEYSMGVQVDLVLALTAVHNYIRIQAGVEALEAGIEDEEVPQELPTTEEEDSTGCTMDRKRQEISRNMWRDYSTHYRRN
jgi:hypothetical protein